MSLFGIHGERIDAYRYPEFTRGSRCTIFNAWRFKSGITVKGLRYAPKIHHIEHARKFIEN